MSNYIDLNPAKLKAAKEKLPPLNIKSFINPRNSWVLVPDGNLLGLFDYVPKHLRVGPWHSMSIVMPLVACIALFYFRPGTTSSSSIKVSIYPAAFSIHWWCHLILFLKMTSLQVWISLYRTPYVIVTYTIQSWILNSLRHGLITLAPFLTDGHALLQIAAMIRFPALLSASVTFLVWNFMLFPMICYYISDTADKVKFVKWNCTYRMVQIHLCNIIYAVIGAQSDSSSQPFDYNDLWYGLSWSVGYHLFYILILDRIGAHIYLIFSPRSKYAPFLLLAVPAAIVALHRMWNADIVRDSISVSSLCFMAIFITVASQIIVPYVLFSKD